MTTPLSAEIRLSERKQQVRHNGATLIKGVAIRFDTPNGKLMVSLPRPARHHDIIHGLAALGFPTPVRGQQGFLWACGDFKDRERAAKLVGHEGLLTSEDLW